MKSWVPLTKSGTAPPAVFTGLAMAFAQPSFQEMKEAKPRVADVLPDPSMFPATPAKSSEVRSTENDGHNAAVEHIRETQSDAEISALKAEIERLKQKLSDEQNAINEKMATDIATSLLHQHETAVAGLLETVSWRTAEVLKPLLNEAAIHASIKDFTNIVAELLKDGSGAEFSVHIPEAFHEHFRKILPVGFEVVPAQVGDPSIKVEVRDVVIASRLAEWSQSITGNYTSE
jgi:hypothetical protein